MASERSDSRDTRANRASRDGHDGERPAQRPERGPGATGTAAQRSPNDMRNPRFWVTLLILLVLNFLIVNLFSGPQQPKTVTIPYSLFKQQVEANNVSSITATGNQIQGDSRDSITYGGASAKHFQTVKPDFADNSLEPLLEQHKVTVNANAQTGPPLWETLLLSFGPGILFFVALLYLMRRAAAAAGPGGILGAFGQSRARLYDAERPSTTFADVAGIDESKAELQEVVDFLREPAKYQRLGGTIPKGVLLIGPPGTGKTLLARAVAGEARVPFFSVAASEFVEAIVGVGASRVRDLFQKARQAAPAIIFIDELDAIGRSRGGRLRLGGNDEQEQTLNQILTEMDGFDSREGVIILAATNRADVLDPALLRPGRFDRRVTVQPPDRRGRAAILRIHTRNVPLGADVDLDAIASQTPGLVGADLRNLVNEAALTAARRGENAVGQDDFLTAIEKILLGSERNLMLSPVDRERIAYHESGHALLGLLVPGADPVRKVTIVPRGQALGVTVQSPVDDRFNYGEDYLRARMTGALGGRAAEAIVYGVITTGAENDLQQVTHLAREMVIRWGMSPRVGPVNYANGEEPPAYMAERPYSDATARLIDEEVKRIADESLAEAMRLLTEHRAQLDALAQALLREDSLDEQEILSVTGLQSVNPVAADGAGPRPAAPSAAAATPAAPAAPVAPGG